MGRLGASDNIVAIVPGDPLPAEWVLRNRRIDEEGGEPEPATLRLAMIAAGIRYDYRPARHRRLLAMLKRLAQVAIFTAAAALGFAHEAEATPFLDLGDPEVLMLELDGSGDVDLVLQFMGIEITVSAPAGVGPYGLAFYQPGTPPVYPAIPEPASSALLAAGLAGLVAVGRRR